MKSNFEFIRKKDITSDEVEKFYGIISSNMKAIGLIVNDDLKQLWVTNLLSSIKKENEFYYVIYKDSNIIGYIEVFKDLDKTHISEVELDNKFKQTKLILEIIRFLISNQDFSNEIEFYYSVNKKNSLSFKTFEHLVWEKIGESTNQFKYKINRKKVENYLQKLNNYPQN